MNVDETAYWISGLFPGEMKVGGFGLCRLATFDASPEHIACTLNFGAVNTGLQAEGRDVRCEIFTVTEQADEAPLLAAGAYQMLIDAEGKIPPQPGSVLPGVATLCRQFDLTAKHGLLTVPFVWGAEVPQFREEDRLTLLMQLILLTDDELVYLNTYGIDALQQELAAAGVNIQDWRR